MRNRVKACRGKVAACVASAVAVALTGVALGGAQLRYTPVTNPNVAWMEAAVVKVRYA